MESVVELVAHRAGNATSSIAMALDVADTVELDVHLFRGRLEVRHAKVVWPFRIHWDRWWIDRTPATPPSLRHVLDAAPADAPLWLDLKGSTTRFTEAVLREVPEGRRVTMSSRTWPVLRPARRRGVRTMRSVGSRWQRWSVLPVRSWAATDGIVIDQRLLTPQWLGRLVGRSPTLVAWGVHDLERAVELVESGVDGLIIDDLGLIGAVRRHVDC